MNKQNKKHCVLFHRSQSHRALPHLIHTLSSSQQISEPVNTNYPHFMEEDIEAWGD